MREYSYFSDPKRRKSCGSFPSSTMEQLLLEPVSAGDIIHLDEARFKVLAVGDVANNNLSALGHIIVKFNGQEVPEMPGDICTEIGKLPEIRVGSLLQITGSK